MYPTSTVITVSKSQSRTVSNVSSTLTRCDRNTSTSCEVHVTNTFRPNGGVRQVNWSQLSPSFFNSITQFSTSPQFQHLDMWNCQIPNMQVLCNFLSSSRALVGLRLSHKVGGIR